MLYWSGCSGNGSKELPFLKKLPRTVFGGAVGFCMFLVDLGGITLSDFGEGKCGAKKASIVLFRKN